MSHTDDNLLRLTEEIERVRVRYQRYRTRRGWGALVAGLYAATIGLALLTILPYFRYGSISEALQSAVAPVWFFFAPFPLFAVGLFANEHIGRRLRQGWRELHTSAAYQQLRALDSAHLRLGEDYALSMDGEVILLDDAEPIVEDMPPNVPPPIPPIRPPQPSEEELMLRDLHQAGRAWANGRGCWRSGWLICILIVVAFVGLFILAQLQTYAPTSSWSSYGIRMTNAVFCGVPLLVMLIMAALINEASLRRSRQRWYWLRGEITRRAEGIRHETRPLDPTARDWLYEDEFDYQPTINTRSSADGR